jgi:hypothetical protein
MPVAPFVTGTPENRSSRPKDPRKRRPRRYEFTAGGRTKKEPAEDKAPAGSTISVSDFG